MDMVLQLDRCIQARWFHCNADVELYRRSCDTQISPQPHQDRGYLFVSRNSLQNAYCDVPMGASATPREPYTDGVPGISMDHRTGNTPSGTGRMANNLLR